MLKDECDKFHEGLREKEDRINKLTFDQKVCIYKHEQNSWNSMSRFLECLKTKTKD